MYVKTFLIFLISTIILGCGQKKVHNILWKGELVRDVDDVHYVSWNKGVQYNSQKKDSIDLKLAGVVVKKNIFIYISLTNNKDSIFTLFPQKSKLSQVHKKYEAVCKPLAPGDIDEKYWSMFSSVLSGAGSISRIFLNIPVDKMIGDYLKPQDVSAKAASKIDGEMNVTDNIFINNHTLFPNTSHAGFLIFEYDSDRFSPERPFRFCIEIAGQEFFAVGEVK